jgi:hypothetical protein
MGEGPPPEIKPEEKPEEDKAQKYAAACHAMDEQSDEEVEKYLHKRWSKHPKWKHYAAACSDVEGGNGVASGDAGGEEGNNAAPVEMPTSGTEHYSRLSGEISKLRNELASERGKRVNAERYQRLTNLSVTHIVDPVEELATCGFGHMTDEQFNAHEGRIRERYQRNPTGLPWPVPDDKNAFQAEPTTGGAVTPALTAKQTAKAVERYERKKAAGEACDFGEILDEVRAGK